MQARFYNEDAEIPKEQPFWTSLGAPFSAGEQASDPATDWDVVRCPLTSLLDSPLSRFLPSFLDYFPLPFPINSLSYSHWRAYRMGSAPWAHSY